MKTNRILAGVAILALSVLSLANTDERKFNYTATDSIDKDFSVDGNISLDIRTKVTVNPYLYVKGNLGAEWVVDGWGSGKDEMTESLFFFHNETLTLDFEKFDNPAKTSGTTTGAQSVILEGGLSFYNDQADEQIYSSGLMPAKDLNGAFEPSGPSFEVDFTGGLMRLDLTRRITITPNVGPGVYENVGVITVIRN